MRNALRVFVLMLSVVMLYGSIGVSPARADGNPIPTCPPNTRTCK